MGSNRIESTLNFLTHAKRVKIAQLPSVLVLLLKLQVTDFEVQFVDFKFKLVSMLALCKLFEIENF